MRLFCFRLRVYLNDNRSCHVVAELHSGRGRLVRPVNVFLPIDERVRVTVHRALHCDVVAHKDSLVCGLHKMEDGSVRRAL